MIIDGVPLDAPLPKQELEGPPPKTGLLPTPTSGPPTALLPTPDDPEKKVIIEYEIFGEGSQILTNQAIRNEITVLSRL